jgi:hypothetical protein
VVVVVVAVAAGEVEAWVGLVFPWMRPGGQGGGLPFDVAGEWESTVFFFDLVGKVDGDCEARPGEGGRG